MSYLPIEAALPPLLTALQGRDEVVLQAPPGAGKLPVYLLLFLVSHGLKVRASLCLSPDAWLHVLLPSEWLLS